MESALSDLTAPFPSGRNKSNNQYEYKEDSNLDNEIDPNTEEDPGEPSAEQSGKTDDATNPSNAQPLQVAGDVSRPEVSTEEGRRKPKVSYSSSCWYLQLSHPSR